MIKKAILVVVLFFTYISPKVLSEQKTDYYYETLSSWGISVSKFGDRVGDKYVIVSSEFDSDLKMLSGQVYFICDIEFSVPGEFQCGSDHFYGPEARKQVVYTHSGEPYEVSIHTLNIGQSLAVTVIPEINFYTPEYRGKMKEYLLSIEAVTEVKDSDISGHPVYHSIYDFARAYRLEYLAYFLAGTYLLVIFGVIQRFMVSRSTRQRKEFLERVFQQMISARWILFYFIALQILGYLPILATISLADTRTIDLQYITSYILDNLNLAKLSELIRSNQFVRVGLLFYNSSLFASLALFFLPNLILLIRQVTVRFVEDSRHRGNLLKAKPVVVLGVLLSVPLFVLGVTSIPLLFFFVSLVYLNLIQKDTGLALRDKVVFSILAVTTLFVTLWLGVGKTNVPEYSVLPGDGGYKVLPIEIDIFGKKFQSQKIAPDFPLLIDDYLVYYPGYTAVENLSIKYLDVLSGNFLLLPADFDDIAEELFTNVTVRELFRTDDITSAFLFSGISYNKESIFNITLLINCDENNMPTDIYMDVYHIEDLVVIKEKENILRFPGCGRSTGIINLEVPWKPDYPAGDVLIAKLRDTEAFWLRFGGIKLSVDGKEADRAYLKYSENIFPYSKLGKEPVLRAYHFGNNSISVYSEHGELNLGDLLNSLVGSGLVHDRVKIWTTVPGHPIIRLKSGE